MRNNFTDIIKELMVTEKSTMLTEKQNKYFFKVALEATKLDIKKAIERLFGVKVKDVNVCNYRGKPKRDRRMRRMGRRSNWKRAIVTLKEGYKIDITAG